MVYGNLRVCFTHFTMHKNNFDLSHIGEFYSYIPSLSPEFGNKAYAIIAMTKDSKDFFC